MLERFLLLVDGAGFEPATSTMPTWRSYQADLMARVTLGFSYPSLRLRLMQGISAFWLKLLKDTVG